MRNQQTQEPMITAIDPNEFLKIDREAFIKKYGKAGRDFIYSFIEQFAKDVESVIGSDEDSSQYAWQNPNLPEVAINKRLEEQRTALAELLEKWRKK